MILTEEEKESKILAFETGKYKLVRQEFRYNWEEGRIAAQKAGDDLNEMVKLINDEYPDWSFSRIAKKIWIDNEDLEGFSRRTIKRYLDDSTIQLLGLADNSTEEDEDEEGEEEGEDIEQSSRTKGGQAAPLLSHNNDTEQSSSSSSTTPAAPTTEPEQEPTDEIKNLDNKEEESDQVKELKQQIQDLEEKLEQLTKNNKIKYKIDFEYDLEIKDQILPLIVTCFPDKETGYVRLNKNPPPPKKKQGMI